VFVVVLGKDLERELALVEQVHMCQPGTRTIVVGETDNPALAGLTWELGATYALFPPTPVEVIADLSVRLLPASNS
jgi:hypothetical protein